MIIFTGYEVYVDPVTLSLIKIGQGQMTFDWTPDVINCNVSFYVITATNCGRCPNTTHRRETTVICTDILADGRECVFTVQAFDNSGLQGNQSVPVVAILKG